MTRTSLHVQIEDDSRAAGKPARGRCYHLRPEHGARGLTSLLTGRRLRSPVPSHSIRIATALIAKPVRHHCGGRRRLTVHSQLVGRLQFSRRLSIARRAQSLRIKPKPAKHMADPFHLECRSYAVGFNANRHSERRLAREQIQVSREQNE